MKFFKILILILILAASVAANARQDEKLVSSDTATAGLIAEEQFETEFFDNEESENEPLFKNLAVHWSRFPNLHPLVVHFPIALLITALLFQFVALFGFRKKLSWTVLSLTLLGFAGGAVAAFVNPPQVSTELSDHLQEVVRQHRHYAYTTLWLAGIAFIFKLGSIEARLRTWAEIIVFLVLFTAALAVGYTGYLGSQMVHIEHIGSEGNYLLEDNP